MARRQQTQRRRGVRRAGIREERRTRHQARKRLRRWLYLAVSGIIGVLIIISLFVPQFQRTSRQTADVNVSRTIPEGEDYFGYDSSPPRYGPSWPKGADWGVHTEDIRDERQVRNLLQGGVLIQYNTEDQELIDQLTQFAERQANYPCYLIVAPYAGAEAAITVTAWGAGDTTDEFDAERLQRFVDTFRDQGPEHVSCVP